MIEEGGGRPVGKNRLAVRCSGGDRSKGGAGTVRVVVGMLVDGGVGKSSEGQGRDWS